MIKVKITHLQRIHFHPVAANFDTLAASQADIAAQTAPRLFADHVFRVTQLDLLERRTPAIDI
jgi:hypothetical protein